MIGQIIQSYLVSLGVQIDKPGFQQADATIKQTGATVEKVAGSMGTSFGAMAANFVKASTIISTALAGVTTSVVGLMTAAAKQDMEMQNYASSMMMGRDAAEQMKRATDALGESINDIIINPELMGQFKQLAADGGKMRVGGDFKETMKNFRELIFEFTRLKQEASYAMTWVGYYLQKYLQRPLADIKERFRQFNDTFIKNMSVWTEKAARAIVYILNIGKHFLDFLMDVGKALYKIWDSFPKGVKIAVAAITALGMVIKSSPLGRMIMLVSTLLLLLDDYYGYMEGKQAAFGEYWDKLNGYIERGKQLWEEIKPVAEEYWDRLTSALQTAKDTLMVLGKEGLEFVTRCIKDTYKWLKNLYERMEDSGAVAQFTEMVDKLYRAVKWVLDQVKGLVSFLIRLHDEVVKTEEYQEFTQAIAELAAVFLELLNTISDLVGEAFKLLFGEMQKTDHVYSFRDAIRAVLKVFSALAGAIKWTLGVMKDLFTYIKNSKVFVEIFEGIGRTIDKAIGKVGKLGRAVLALMNGEGIQKALSILGASDSDSSGGTPGGSSNEEYIWSWLKAAGFSDAGAAAVMGNLRQEAGADFNFGSTEDGSGAFKVDGKTGFGIVQWTSADRQQGLLDMANHLGKSVYDRDVQLNYMLQEMQERGVLDEVKNATNVESATKVFHDRVEGSDDYNAFGGIQHRYDYANEMLNRHRGQTYFQGGGSSDVPAHYLGAQPMESSLDGVWWFKDLNGWIGGVLKQEGAGNAEYSSGQRTREHNARVGGADDSYHIYGDAVDIVLPPGANTEAIKARFEPYFKEVLYHNVGSGLHLHLGGYKGNAPSAQTSGGAAPSPYGGGSSGGSGASGSWGLVNGQKPKWMTLNDIAKLGRNPSVGEFAAAMDGGARGNAPSYSLPSGGGFVGAPGLNIGSIGDVIVQITGGVAASANEVGEQFQARLPGALRDAAGYFGLNLTTTDLR